MRGVKRQKVSGSDLFVGFYSLRLRSPEGAVTKTVFVYDGWNLIAELDGTTLATKKTYAWGLDLSGSLTGAGGVGGLLWVNVAGSGAHFVSYDGNGNVVGLNSATDGSNTARYEYGPFGEPIRVTGTRSTANPIRFSSKYTDQESGLVYYGYRFYNAVTGRWPNRDPFGLKDYKKGTDDPTIKSDGGAGAWGSEEWTWRYVELKQLIVNNIGIVWVGMPDAVNHLQHYFGNSGSDYTIRLQKMIDDVPSARNVYNGELALAQAFVESLSDGKHSITSRSASGGYNRKAESWNWFYAVGGYSAWGKGNATVCKNEYTLEFQYKFSDRYNWDGGKQVTILGQVVTDQFMGEFHRQGLAREFDMFGAVKKTVKWKKGQAPKVTEGWESEQGR